MLPTKTPASNVVYLGPTEDIGNLYCKRIKPGEIESDWILTDEEREIIAAGGNVSLRIFTEPIPPVSLSVTYPFCIIHDIYMHTIVDGKFTCSKCEGDD